MSNDNEHNHNHNHNNHNERLIDQPPPKKKRKRLFTEYDEFISIIDKLSKSYDPALLSCIKYTNKVGLTCDICKLDTILKGPWTTKYVKCFNYTMNLLLFRKILCLFSGIIDIERQNGIKKWIVHAKRERLLTSKLDQILRIFCNSPAITGTDIKKKWLVAVAKIWWSSADREVDCSELDVMCNECDEDIDIQMS